jgi:hypothetical protein
MTTTLTASDSPALPINQALADYEEFRNLYQEAFDLEQNTLRRAKDKLVAVSAKWAEPVVQAVLCTTKKEVYGPHIGPSFLDFAHAIKDDPRAWDAATRITDEGGEEDDVMLALGFGMVAGMMYAQLTGMKLPMPELPAEEEVAPDAPQVA